MTMTFVLIGVGVIIGFIGVILILIAAFRTNVWWGVGILAAEFGPPFFIKNPFVSSSIGLIVVLLFVIQHWTVAKTGFIAYVVGTALVVPATFSMFKQMRTAIEQQQVAQAQSHLQEPVQAESAQPAYVPERPRPVVQAAAMPLPSEPILPARPAAVPSGVSRERPAFVMKPLEQVYVMNSTKKYYPLDCKAQPEGGYRMAKSLAKGQGFTLAAECTE